jgi:hypothetical protein
VVSPTTAACRPPSASLLKSNKATENSKWKGGDPLRAKTPEQKLEKGWKKYVNYHFFFKLLVISFKFYNLFYLFFS